MRVPAAGAAGGGETKLPESTKGDEASRIRTKGRSNSSDSVAFGLLRRRRQQADELSPGAGVASASPFLFESDDVSLEATRRQGAGGAREADNVSPGSDRISGSARVVSCLSWGNVAHGLG